MLAFLRRRLLSVPLLLLSISILTYMLLGASPGDFFSGKEQDPKYTFDYVMALRASVGRAVEVPEKERALSLPSFSAGGVEYSFDDSGRLLREGAVADPRMEQTRVKRFRSPDGRTEWSLSERGRLYRHIGRFEGYFVWLGNVFRGDFGESWSNKASVVSVVWSRLGNTVILEVLALLIAWGVAIPLGVWSGVRPNSKLDHACGAIAYMSLSVPGLFLALLALLFALSTGLFPVGDMRSVDHDRMSAIGRFLDILWHATLPALVIGLTSIAYYMRQMRGQMVEAMSSDYVRTARAKGVPERRVQFRHALRNAINPLVTMFGFSLAALMSGSFLVELVFNWPGLAMATTQAVFSKDEPLVMASVLFASLLLVAGNFVADLLLVVVDPRIRLE